MGLISGFAVFFIIWWTVFIASLPWGVRTALDEGATPGAGHAPSAPLAPRLLRKALWTTFVSAIIFGLYVANLSYGWLTLADFPGPFQEYGPDR